MGTEQIAEAIGKATDYLRENPAEARYTDTPTTAVLGEGLRCTVEAPAGGPIVTDMPPSVGGGGEAPSPGWILRAAQASCDATVIAMQAAKEGVTLSRLEVTVDSESDDRGLLGVEEDVPAGPLTTRTRVRIEADGVEPERLREIVETARRHSPVQDAVCRAVPESLDIETA